MNVETMTGHCVLRAGYFQCEKQILFQIRVFVPKVSTCFQMEFLLSKGVFVPKASFSLQKRIFGSEASFCFQNRIVAFKATFRYKIEFLFLKRAFVSKSKYSSDGSALHFTNTQLGHALRTDAMRTKKRQQKQHFSQLGVSEHQCFRKW